MPYRSNGVIWTLRKDSLVNTGHPLQSHCGGFRTSLAQPPPWWVDVLEDLLNVAFRRHVSP